MKLLLTLVLITLSISLYAQFSGSFDPSNWTLSNTPGCDNGNVDASSAPASIRLNGSETAGCGNSTTGYSVSIDVCGTISFDWDYTTVDCNGSFYDRFGYSVNGVPTQLTVDCFNDCYVQSGSASVNVNAGDVFSFYMNSIDNFCGIAWSDISNFTAPSADCYGDDGELKVQVCHRGKTICIAPSAVAAHLAHGDAVGGCEETADCGSGGSGFHAHDEAVEAKAAKDEHILAVRNAVDQLHQVLSQQAAVDIESLNQVYPNPAKNVANIKLDRMDGPTNIVIYNQNGQVVMQTSADVVRGLPIEINIESLLNGNYEIRFESQQGMTAVEKLTVMRSN